MNQVSLKCCAIDDTHFKRCDKRNCAKLKDWLYLPQKSILFSDKLDLMETLICFVSILNMITGFWGLSVPLYTFVIYCNKLSLMADGSKYRMTERIPISPVE